MTLIRHRSCPALALSPRTDVVAMIEPPLVSLLMACPRGSQVLPTALVATASAAVDLPAIVQPAEEEELPANSALLHAKAVHARSRRAASKLAPWRLLRQSGGVFGMPANRQRARGCYLGPSPYLPTAREVYPSPARRATSCGRLSDFDGFRLPSTKHPPAFARPSEAEGTAAAVEVQHIGEPVALGADVDWNALGNAVHAFFAAVRPDANGDDETLAAEVLKAWDIPAVVTGAHLLTWTRQLESWSAQHWPSATWHREWPVMLRLPEGTVLRGTADLVLETSDGFVLVDHKLIKSGLAEAVEKARGFAGQLRSYAEATTAATGKPCLASFVYLPAHGALVSYGSQMINGRQLA
jgi:hypothetical protein